MKTKQEFIDTVHQIHNVVLNNALKNGESVNVALAKCLYLLEEEIGILQYELSLLHCQTYTNKERRKTMAKSKSKPKAAPKKPAAKKKK